jgi:hypothetical protein
LTPLRHLGCGILGAAVGLAAVTVHRHGPLGLLLAVLTSAATGWALAASRRPALATSYAGGWLVVFGLVFLGTPEGDYAIAADGAGYTLMGTSLLVVAIGASGLRRIAA